MSATPQTMETIGQGQATRHAPSEPLLPATSAKAPRTGFALIAQPGVDGTTTVFLSAGQRDAVLRFKAKALHRASDGATLVKDFTDHPAPASVGHALSTALDEAVATIVADVVQRTKQEHFLKTRKLIREYKAAVSEGRDTRALVDAIDEPIHLITAADIVVDHKSKAFTFQPSVYWTFDAFLRVILAAVKKIQFAKHQLMNEIDI
ncbi:hypothetical protein SDRG_08521 [Saprolegnia diclina VS20]|uniref:Uncharacterized protein n=1 Tax=Saprolegnia diclina (strain VS20) TaxID=1156394 RepID=T0QJB6_SAPDV|nr:hypothetical protein SDRG_08521 [Saprolegnia diclina VS20]EQC33840.1 hypothetical protein SDRG_08521 [Saprolegnia diclina VS20]|eukprot:XP_008612635.1 hypothetical protein SDRG_08521 [Saprolegnia diclina VS20]